MLCGRLDDAKKKAGHSGMTDDERRAADAEVEACAHAVDGAAMPVTLRLIVGDVTPERAVQIAAGMGGRLALLGDEAGVLGTFLGRYSQGAANLDALLSGHSGSRVTVDRKGDAEPIRIERPAFTVALGFQPALFEGMAGDRQVDGRGLVERFLLSCPPSHLGYRAADSPGIPPGVADEWDGMVRRAFQPFPAPSLTPAPLPVLKLTLSGGARRVLHELHDDIEPRMRPGGDLHGHTRVAGKMGAQCVRLAGVLHVAILGVDAAEKETPIGESTMQAAAQLARYFLEHARALTPGSGSCGDRREQQVLDALEDRGELTGTEVRDLFDRHLPAAEVDRVMQSLTDSGRVAKAERPTGGRPVTVYTLATKATKATKGGESGTLVASVAGGDGESGGES